MVARVYFIGRVGRISSGPDAGRYLKVLDSGDRKHPGYRIVLATDAGMADEVGDDWVASIEDLPQYFEDLGALIDWLD